MPAELLNPPRRTPTFERGPGRKWVCAAAVLALLLSTSPGLAQGGGALLTVFDRRGNVLHVPAERGPFRNPVVSPDGTRVLTTRFNDETNGTDLWVWNLETGEIRRIVEDSQNSVRGAAIWSPDGMHVVYPSIHNGVFGVSRRSADGRGEEERLYEHEGSWIRLAGWSAGGRALSFLADGFLYLLPTDGDGQAAEVGRLEANGDARLSPDGRLLAYCRIEGTRLELFVRPVSAPGAKAPVPDTEWHVSPGGGHGLIAWRDDGRELYYLAADGGLNAVEVRMEPGIAFGPPRLVTAVPKVPRLMGASNPSSLGTFDSHSERFVFVVEAPTLHRITVFDRGGNVTARVGPPGIYVRPVLSPDGSHVAVEREDLETGFRDIWTFDVASGRGNPVTFDWPAENNPAWSPDGQVGYSAFRGETGGIYRRPADGGDEGELLFRYTPGAGVELGEFSSDGQFLTFTSGGVVLVVPLDGDDPLAREALAFGRSEFVVFSGRFSPDGHYLAYRTDETGTFQAHVRELDTATGGAGERNWQASRSAVDRQGISWRRDGRELYFMRTQADPRGVQVLAVDVSAGPDLEFGRPRELFVVPGELPRQKFVSHDGERFVFLVPVAADDTPKR